MNTACTSCLILSLISPEMLFANAAKKNIYQKNISYIKKNKHKPSDVILPMRQKKNISKKYIIYQKKKCLSTSCLIAARKAHVLTSPQSNNMHPPPHMAYILLLTYRRDAVGSPCLSPRLRLPNQPVYIYIYIYVHI